MNIDELEKKESELAKKLQSVRRDIRDAKLEDAAQKYGVRIGSVVVSETGKRHRVTKIDTSWKGRPWVRGNPEKADGTFGTSVRDLFGEWKAEE